MNEHTTVETKPRAVFSTEDLTLIKETILFSLQYDSKIEDKVRRKLNYLYHRLGRI